jgi:hypothetical protein
MSAPQQAMPFRLAHSSLQLALRLWPEETRDWGHALAAELHEIEKPLEALRWAIGGLMLFSRASASHFLTWLKLPAGSRLSPTSLLPGTTAPILPKRSRLFTTAILATTAILFFLPQGREAVSTILESWNGFQGSRGDLHALEKLAVRAEKQKDARTLAFVASYFPERERAIAYADRAVALDPTLTWTYASHFGWQGFAPYPKAWLERLSNSDPGNAYPELIAASSISEPRYQALLSNHTPTEEETETAVGGDPVWVTYMDRAFHAPRYDSYFSRDWQLTREVWNRESSVPASAVFSSLWSHSFPDWLSIETYARRLIRNAREASAAGNSEQARTLLVEVDSFGRMMADQGERDFERYDGLSLSRQATIALQDLYVRTGQTIQATQATQRLQQIDSRRDALTHSFRGVELAQSSMLERRAILIHSSAGFAMLSVLAIVLGLLALELRREKEGNRGLRLRKAICFLVDWAPVGLLAACIGLLWAFQPFASLLRSARNASSASAAWHTLHFEGLFILSNSLGPLFDPFTPYRFWQALICALVALALFLLVRGFLRYKRA